jgi:pyridoxamine 5'-phosphate oxidase
MTDDHFYNDLDQTREQVWKRLGRGVADRRSGLHTVQLATLGRDGTPRVRTLVLRGVSASERTLRLHTDRRASKFTELSARPEVEICGYDAKAKVQLRLRGHAAVHTEEGADAAWAASTRNSRACYRTPLVPGSPLQDPTAADPVVEAEADQEAGRQHFSVILVTLSRIEWLYLAARGHRRAFFEWVGDDWRGCWLVP